MAARRHPLYSALLHSSTHTSMSDSGKLLSVLALTPVLIFSVFGFLATFEPVSVDEIAGAGPWLQRVLCAGLALGSLALMGRLASQRCRPLARN